MEVLTQEWVLTPKEPGTGGYIILLHPPVLIVAGQNYQA